MQHAQHVVELERPVQGEPRRKHLQVAARRGVAAAAAALAGPELPEHVAYLWDWYLELNAARAPGHLTYVDIDAWARLTGRTPDPDEVRGLLELDACVAAQSARTT